VLTDNNVWNFVFYSNKLDIVLIMCLSDALWDVYLCWPVAGTNYWTFAWMLGSATMKNRKRKLWPRTVRFLFEIMFCAGVNIVPYRLKRTIWLINWRLLKWEMLTN